MLTLSDTDSGTTTATVPATFWTLQKVRKAIDDLDLGKVLALVDRHTDLTRADIVRLTGISASEVSRHIRGRRHTRNNGLIRQALEGLGLPSAAKYVDPITAPAMVPTSMNTMLEALSRSSSELLIQVEQDAVSDWSAAAVEEHLRRTASRYLTVPLEETLTELMQVNDHLSAWRIRTPSPSRTREVWALAGWHAALAGWVSIDQGRPCQAATHHHAAQACVQHSGHEGVIAWTAMLNRTISYWQERRREGAQHAAAGLAAAERVGGGAQLITLSALAQDHAHLGDQDTALDLLARARAVLHVNSTQDSDLAGPLKCGPSRAYGYHTETLLDLERPLEAVRVAEEGLEMAADLMVRNARSERMLLLHLALGLARLGHTEEAMANIVPVLDTPQGQRATPLRLRLRRVGRALPSGVETDTLKERIAEFIRTT